MKDPFDWTEQDLLDLIDNKVEENFELEYKRCASLGKGDAERNEVSKDVSAMANAAGGTIVYGIKETKDHKPEDLDDGFDPAVISKEWLEQVINSRIHPRVQGIRIKPVPLPSKGGKVAYVVTIPQATTLAPHQAYDNKYYKRFNFEAVAMQDYEIRDILRRSSAPDLYVWWEFERGREVTLQNDERDDGRFAPVPLTPMIGNRSPEPAHYAVIMLLIDERLEVGTRGGRRMERAYQLNNGLFLTAFVQNHSSPAHLPIFREQAFALDEVRIRQPLVLESTRYFVGYIITTPGSKTEGFTSFTAQGAKARWDDPWPHA